MDDEERVPLVSLVEEYLLLGQPLQHHGLTALLVHSRRQIREELACRGGREEEEEEEGGGVSEARNRDESRAG